MMERSPRYQAVDVARGVAFVAMFYYHATFFATARGLVEVPITTDPGWRAFQKCIAGTFYFLVGVSLVLANRDRIHLRPWLVRMAKLCGGAAIVTAASLALDPRLLVRYGILHNIAVCSAVGLLLLRLGWWNLPLGALLVGLGATISSPAFDPPWLQWIGLGAVHPPTFDFQPFLPWMGVVCFGLWAGVLLAEAPEGAAVRWRGEAWPLRGLTLLGRWSLLSYMAHVPVLVGTVEALAWLRGI